MKILPPPHDVGEGYSTSQMCQRTAGDIEPELVAEGVRRGMFVVEDWVNANPDMTFDSLLAATIMDTSLRQIVKSRFQQDSAVLVSAGFGQYIDGRFNLGGISALVRDTMIQIQGQFETFVHSTQPALEQTIQFWNEKLGAWNTYAGCEGEKRALKLFAASAMGFAKYYYATRTHNSLAQNEVELRRCSSFWEGLLCGTLSAAVGIFSGYLTSDLAAGGLNEAGINCGVMGNPAPPETCADIVGTVLGIAAGGGFLRWCCSWFGGNEVICRNPQSYGYRVLSCNQYEVAAYGAGNGVATYFWDNVNTAPAAATTTAPFLVVTVPDPGQPSTIRVRVLCANGFEIPISIPQEITLNSGQPGALGWAVAPPAEAAVGQTVQVAVSADIAFPQSLSWSASFGGGVTSTGSHTANVHFWASGAVTITATLTNTCNGQPVTVSRVVNVKP